MDKQTDVIWRPYDMMMFVSRCGHLRLFGAPLLCIDIVTSIMIMLRHAG